MHLSALLWSLYAMFGQVAIRSLGVVYFKATKIIERPISDKARSAATLFVLLARRAETSHCPNQRSMAQNGSFAKSRRNAGPNPWRGARTFSHRTSKPCLMRGGKSHLRGYDEHERASWLRIRSTHLEPCMRDTSCGPRGAPKNTNPAAAGSGNGEESAVWEFSTVNAPRIAHILLERLGFLEPCPCHGF